MKSWNQKQMFFLGLFTCLLMVGTFLFSAYVWAQPDLNLGLTPASNIGLGGEDIRVIIAKIIRAVLSMLGVVALAIIIYGGFVYMTAAGNEENVTKAKKILINGVIGLMIILSSLAIVQFILNKLLEATGAGTGTSSQCDDWEWALQHPKSCFPDEWDDVCKEDPLQCCIIDLAEQGIFVAKSITPRTESTGMNNAGIRTIFTQSISDKYEAKEVFKVKLGDKDISDQFSYIYALTEAGERMMVEARYIGENKCADGTPCLEFGDYEVNIKTDLESQDGQVIMEETDCGDFPLVAKFNVDVEGEEKVAFKDIVPPFATPITINDLADVGQVLKSGKIYKINTKMTDNSGAGYVKLSLEQDLSGGNKDLLYNYYHGPHVNRGSDAPEQDPYLFNYYLGVPKTESDKPIKYYLTIDAFDIDYNHVSVTTNFVVGKLKDVGDDCAEDWECDSGKCVDGKCIAFPTILDVMPLTGATGNYVTVLGKYFGPEMGTVSFADDGDKNGKIDETDIWHKANVVLCENEISWNDKWVIVEVPDDISLPLDSTSSIQLVRADDPALMDYTTDNWGPKPGGDGLFTKTDEKLPGLCAVKALVPDENDPNKIMETTAAIPKTPVKAIGAGLGDAGKNAVAIRFGGKTDSKTKKLSGGIQAPYTSWSDILVMSKVPEAMSPGEVAVYVSVDDKPSNGVPFTVLTEDDLKDYYPTIEVIDPQITTPLSFVTLYGTGFGEETGMLVIAKDSDLVDKCLKDGIKPGCFELSTTDLPEFCGDTWSNTQIVAKVIKDTTAGDYFVGLKNAWGFQTITDADLLLKIEDGSPLPSICKLAPDRGPAPLPKGGYVDLYGVNFKPLDNQAANSEVYFWRSDSDPGNLATWLKKIISKQENQKELEIGFLKILADGEQIRTDIPLDEIDGKSMSEGPIKVKANGKTGNSVKYTVEDCRLADEKTKEIMTTSTPPYTVYQCCEADGPDLGAWKPASHICAGDVREAGYVWRFTTGNIIEAPYVVEECNEVDWNQPGKIVSYPSPVPSTLWKRGQETCLNATIAVKFSTGMATETLTPDNVKVYECAGNVNSANCEAEKKLLPAEELDMIYLSQGEKGGVLEIRKIPPQKQFDPYKWYRVELSDKIYSVTTEEVLGEVKQKLGLPLQQTKPCGLGTAYCFEFKTASNLCTLKGVGINPQNYVAHFLGLILDPIYPMESVPPHPLYYYLWGKGSQECTVLNADGLGWNWDTSKHAWATVVKSPKPPYYTDSRAEVSAEADTEGDAVKITATAQGLDLSNEHDVLAAIGSIGKMTIKSEVDIKGADHLPFEQYVIEDNYNVEVKYELDDVDEANLAAVKKPFKNSDGAIDYYFEAVRYIYKKGAVNEIYVIEQFYPDNVKKRGFVFIGWGKVEHWQDYDAGKIGNYQIMKAEGKLVLYDNKTGKKVQEKEATPVPEGLDLELLFKSPVVIGGKEVGLNPMKGVISKLLIKQKAGEVNETLTGTSFLKVDLGPPEVVDSWPNCLEACINSRIGVKFNRKMYQPSYEGKIKVQECKDEQCVLFTDYNQTWDYDLAGSNDYHLRAVPNDILHVLKPDTWYRVTVAGKEQGVKSLGQLNPPKPGKGMVEDYIWKFKTKADPSPCAVNAVGVIPDPFEAHWVNEKTAYSAQPKSAPDQCSAFGQELNPWWYGWEWDSGDKKVATITNFPATQVPNKFCGQTCTLRGSDILQSQTAPVAICGDGNVGLGEDCDIAAYLPGKDPHPGNEEIPGISCTLDCLRPGNEKYAATTTPGYCGNGGIENAIGEECDPGIPGLEKFCTDKCQWIGSKPEKPADEDLPICHSGSVTKGEECDTADEKTKAGCTNQCLNAGSQLVRYWCDFNGDDWWNETKKIKVKDLSECQQAKSVCGNNIIESGEECEIGTDQLSVRGKDGEITIPETNPGKYCSDYCLLVNLCDLKDQELENTGLKCSAGKEGCKEDCTLSGSSIAYKESSLCGDGKEGLGEYIGCEKEAAALDPKDVLDSNPMQVSTAIGEGKVVEEKKSQYTNILATVKSFKDVSGKKNKLPDPAQKTGKGDYYFKCGYTEFLPYQEQKYNNCPLPEQDSALVSFGVAENSCCYLRPQRVVEYPADGAGINTDPVCRNTYMEVQFNGYIEEKSLSGNLLIAVGYPEGKYPIGDNSVGNAKEYCSKNGGLDVTTQVKESLAYAGKEIENGASKGFWQKMWQWMKTLLARLFVDSTYASQYDLSNTVEIWCSGGITAEPLIQYQWDKEKHVTSTIALLLNNLLPVDTPIAVILQGGNGGITSADGVGIRNPEKDSLVDSWVFKTGKEVCKLASVEVEPPSYLFNTPYTKNGFKALAKSKNGQSIVSIPGIYAWEWDWQPQDNKILEIPAQGSDSKKPLVDIASRNVEGHVVAVASALVTHDTDLQDNQLNQNFIGISDIEVKFCENPWPKKIGQIEWYPFKDPDYNFSMSYCADSGQSGDTNDDLPFLKSQLTYVTEAANVPEKCTASGEFCKEDIDCPFGLYKLPWVEEPIAVPEGKGMCWDLQKEPYEIGGKYFFCEDAADCPSGIPVGLLSQINEPGYGSVKSIVKSNKGYLYGVLGEEDALWAIDVSNPENPIIKDVIEQPGLVGLEMDTINNWLIGIADISNEPNLFIYDISDPAVMNLKSKMMLPGSPVDLYRHLNRLYVVTDDGATGKFISIAQDKLTQESLPTDAIITELDWPATKVFAGFQYIHVIAHSPDNKSGRLYAVIKNSLTGELKGSLDFDHRPIDLYVKGETAYISIADKSGSGTGGIIWNDLDGGNSKFEMLVKTQYYPRDLTLTDNFSNVYFTTNKGLQVMRLSDKTMLLDYQVPGTKDTKSMYVDGNTVYLGDAQTAMLSILHLDLKKQIEQLFCQSYDDLKSYSNQCKALVGNDVWMTQALAADALRSHLFFNETNDDAIGIQIFKNPKNLSVSDWYSLPEKEGGKGFSGSVQGVEIAGYDAITDGTNYYINALNKSDDSILYNNIYLFSLNKGAQEPTDDVFKQLIDSLSFNINLTDFGYCGTDINTPDYKYVNSACNSDVDCFGLTGVSKLIQGTGKCGLTGGDCNSNEQCPSGIGWDNISKNDYYCYGLDLKKKNICPNGFSDCNSGEKDMFCIPDKDKYTYPMKSIPGGCYKDGQIVKYLGLYPITTCTGGDIVTCLSKGGHCEIDEASNEIIPFTNNNKCDGLGEEVDIIHEAPVCANSKTKLMRDWDRLHDIQNVQTVFHDYFKETGSYPILESGTFIPGYTVSMWPSWGKLGQELGSSLLTDKVNAWAGCDPASDQQTCWNAKDSIYSCPAVSKVYEYEFVTSSDSYMLHGPLEFMTKDDQIAKDFIKFNYFSTEPWCKPGEVYSPFGDKCGDDILNINEQCEPPGEIKPSLDWGVISQQEKNGCVLSYDNADYDNSCGTDLDCGQKVYDNGTFIYADKPKVCTFKIASPKLIIDLAWKEAGGKGTYAFGCVDVDECLDAGHYMNRAFKGGAGKIGFMPTDPHVFDANLSIWLLSNQTKIGCTSLDSLYPTQQKEQIKCKFAGEKEFGSCPEGTQAFKICTNGCQWDYSSCKSPYDCGNGIVEGEEACDDGGLNGSYGHCNLLCTGLYNEYCGDGDLNGDTNNNNVADKGENWLEYCEKTSGKYVYGFCELKTDETCLTKSNCNFPITPLNPFGVNPYQSCKTKTDQMGLTYYDCGSCVLDNDPSYHPKKEYSCAWDCQGPGGYCGDDIRQAEYEECDDGNYKTLDGCNKLCQTENIACKQQNPVFTTSTNPMMITTVEITKGGVMSAEHIAACTQNTNGNKICRAYGLGCKQVDFWSIVNSTYKEITPIGGSCKKDLTEYMDYLTSMQVECYGIYEGKPPVEGDEKPGNCGDNKVQPGEEVCDKGNQNGIACVPDYGKSCSYCSNDCQEVLAVDSPYYCGNNKIDQTGENDGKPVYEICEYVDSKVVDSLGKEQTCTDKGEVKCNSCLEIDKGNCEDCGFIDDGAIPYVYAINVLAPNSGKVGWPVQSNLKSSLRLFYSGSSKSILNVFHKTAENPLSFPAGVKINTNTVCNQSDEYPKHYEVQFSPMTTPIGEKTLFDFPVNFEEKKVTNYYPISPKVPNSTSFRIVIRWGEEMKGVEFGGTVYNQGFSWMGEPSWVRYPDVAADKNICNSVDYAIDCDNKDYGGVYVHERKSTANYDGNVYVQAVTIDTSKRGFATFNYAFAVQQFSYKKMGDQNMEFTPIVDFASKDLIVEVYEYDVNKSNLIIYKPDKVFSIKDAESASYSGAIYWHVFNLEYDNGKYKVVPVQKITTDEETLKKAVPLTTPPNIPVGYSYVNTGVSVDPDSIFNNKPVPPLFVGNTDLAVIGREPGFDAEAEGYSLLLVAERFDTKIDYESCLEQQYTVANCYNLITNTNKHVNMSDWPPEGADSGFGNEILFNRMDENIPYRFIYRLHDWDADVDPDPEEWEMLPQLPFKNNFIYNTDNFGFSKDGVKAYIGFGDALWKFKMIQPAKSNGNSPFVLNYQDYARLKTDDTQWYVFNAVRQKNNIFIDIIDKFLPSTVGFGDYVKYD